MNVRMQMWKHVVDKSSDGVEIKKTLIDSAKKNHNEELRWTLDKLINLFYIDLLICYY